MVRILQILVMAALVTGAGWYVLQALRPPEEDPDDQLRTVEVGRGEIVREVRIIGSVAPVLLTQIKSEVPGRVIKVAVENGDEVKEGTLLIELDRSELESQREELQRETVSSRLRVDKARRDYERVLNLRQRDFSTEQELLDSKTALALEENSLAIQDARLRTLNEKLAKTRILAPHDGVVLNLDITPGKVLVGANSFSQGDVPMEVADLRRLRIEAKVNEVDLAALRLKQKAVVTFASIPGLEAEATVVNISPSAEKPDRNNRWAQPENVLFPVRLHFTATDPRIKPGISALATIVADRLDNTLTVPISAIFYEDDEAFVFRKTSDSWEKVDITPGLNSFDMVAVAEGLEEGDILALGLPRLFDPRATDTP